MGRVVRFEIHAAKPERAAQFYAQVFDWEIKKWEGPQEYWLIMTGRQSADIKGKENDGIDGAIIRRMSDNPDRNDTTPVVGYVCTIAVDDLDAAIEKVKEAGGSEALAKMPVPGVGWLAYYKDTENNTFGMMQSDEAAA